MAEAVAQGLYVVRDGVPRLIAGRRRGDGRMKFPLPAGAEASLYEAVELPAEGVLWSYTVQRFRPKTPPYIGDDDEASFVPFAVGYVEFPGQVIVEGRILTDDPARLKIGLAMTTAIESFPTSTRGTADTYAFRPSGQ
ncbi:MAG: OB-fold domain-containing protein [Caulobacteraceae bacterium]